MKSKKAKKKKPAKVNLRGTPRLGRVNMKTLKKNLPSSVMYVPGPQAMQAWLGINSDLFNITRVEVTALLPGSSLRQTIIGKDPRKMSWKQYEALREFLLPKLLEAAFILQNYGNDFIEKPITG